MFLKPLFLHLFITLPLHFAWNKWILLHCSDHYCHFSDKDMRVFWGAVEESSNCVQHRHTCESRRKGARRKREKWAEETKKKLQLPCNYSVLHQTLNIFISEGKKWERMRSRRRSGERGGSRKEIISSHAWCAFMTLSAHTSKETRQIQLPFSSTRT